jgi:2-dehydro-3-deoxyphosphogluconate aldolase / (4S)-4-hydroxy-2-oxoglutarate aldolase
MRTRSEIDAWLTRQGIVAVVRTPAFEQVAPVCEALVAGGVLSLEITLTVPRALDAIREMSRRFGAQAVVGVGTVLNPAQGAAAIEAGAEFLVSPITRIDLIELAHKAGKPVMIGAYTPTEAQLAHEAGADFVKLFPADKLGASHVKNLRGPLPHLRIVPTGGVDLKTAADFLKAGCAALGVGGSLITADVLKTSNWAELARLAGEYVRIVTETRAGISRGV